MYNYMVYVTITCFPHWTKSSQGALEAAPGLRSNPSQRILTHRQMALQVFWPSITSSNAQVFWWPSKWSRKTKSVRKWSQLIFNCCLWKSQYEKGLKALESPDYWMETVAFQARLRCSSGELGAAEAHRQAGRGTNDFLVCDFKLLCRMCKQKQKGQTYMKTQFFEPPGLEAKGGDSQPGQEPKELAQGAHSQRFASRVAFFGQESRTKNVQTQKMQLLQQTQNRLAKNDLQGISTERRTEAKLELAADARDKWQQPGTCRGRHNSLLMHRRQPGQQ